MTNSWFHIKAAGEKRATIGIDGEIGAWGVSSHDFKNALNDLGDIQNLRINLSTVGGSWKDGTAIKNTLLDHPAKVHVHIDSYALSVGSVIAMGGDKISANDDSIFMIHNPWGGPIFGNSADLRKQADILEKHTDAIVKSYNAKAIDLTEDEIRAAMDEESWYSADEAKDLGFIDQVIATGEDRTEGAVAYASANIMNFKNAPKSVLQRLNSAIHDSGSAAKPEKETMPDEVTMTEAELQDRINSAVSEAVKDKGISNDILNHPKASIEKIKAAADMGLSDEQTLKFFNYAPEPEEKPEPKPDSTETEEKEKESSASAILGQLVDAMNKNSELNDVNKNASRANADESDKPPKEAPADMLARIRGV